MGSAYLNDFIENAEEDLDIILPPALRGELDFSGLQRLCERFRRRGVCNYLLTGNPTAFSFNMMQSAGAALAVLPEIDEAQKVGSQAKPLYDAIGGGFWDAAAVLARLNRTTWNQTREYEDDFLFVTFLVKHFFMNASEGECRQIIVEHERAAEGQDAEHRDICVAFLEKDGQRFHNALNKILATRAAKVEALVEQDVLAEEDWSWLRYFSLEGLALLRLADCIGLSTGTDYLHVSEGLRRANVPPFDPNAWRRGRARS